MCRRLVDVESWSEKTTASIFVVIRVIGRNTVALDYSELSVGAGFKSVLIYDPSLRRFRCSQVQAELLNRLLE